MSADEHHILPLNKYLAVAGALLLLTVVTVLAAKQDFGAWNVAIAMLIASVKALLVILYFMHLRYDSPLYAIVFGSAILFLAIFIAFTLMDEMNRDSLYSVRDEAIQKYAVIYDENGRVKAKRSAGDLTEFEMTHGIGPITAPLNLGPPDPAKAERGKRLFDIKCASCHRLDERLVGPPLREVTKRRTNEYILNMILNPDEMAKVHPVAHQLLAEYLTFMTFQNVTEDDAKLLLEYLRVAGQQAPGG